MELEERSGSSKHSESRPFATNGSSYHYDEYPHLRVRIASSESFLMDPEVDELSGSSKSSGGPEAEIIDENKSKEHTESHLHVIDYSGSSKHSESTDDSESTKHLESYPEMIDGGEISKQSTSHIDVAVNECSPFRPAPHLGSSSSSNATSLHSSSDDIFREDVEGSFNPRMFSSHKPHQEAQTATQEFQLIVPRSNSSKSEEHDPFGCSSTLTLPDVTFKAFDKSGSTISPQIQVMDRSVRYDPLRIPSSVFERSSTELDWSSASNDSLFSIHVGNNSFSRDHLCFFNSMNKSAEPVKSDELLILIPAQPSPAGGTDDKSKIPIADTDIRSTETQENGATELAVKSNKNATEMGAEDLTEEKKEDQALPSKSSSTTNQSGSGDSASSFAFPILTGGLKCRSEKADVKEKHLQAPVVTATSKSDFRYWFPTFSCWAWNCPFCRCWCRYRWCRCHRHRCCCA